MNGMKTFLLGAVGYPLLEMAWRGRTHWSMSIAGGASAVLIGRIRRLRASTARRAIMCAAGITAVEYACGKLWNRDHRVWDYRRVPLNLRGQICLPYTLLWGGLSAALIKALDMTKGRPPRQAAGRAIDKAIAEGVQ